MSKVYHLGEQLNDLEARLYGDTDEDCGDIDNLESDLIILDETLNDIVEKLIDSKKPVKKLKIK